MGVSGSGKSYIGRLLAKKLDFHFIEGDDYHPKSNIQKMAGGEALNDTDRLPWLRILNAAAIPYKTTGVVIACSALKERYRKELMRNIASDACLWVFLEGSFELIEQRLSQRTDHFMPSSLLRSQFETLEIPKHCFKVDIQRSAKQIINTIHKKIMQKSQFGVMGLGVMGTSLSRNLARNGVHLSLYNRHLSGKEEGVAKKRIVDYSELQDAKGFDDLERFVASIEKPRKILLVLTAGPAIDEVIGELQKYMEAGDILIDGGNSHFHDTSRRTEALLKQGIYFLGMGISGGEKGALEGPSLMPGGSKQGYLLVKDILLSIAAKSFNGVPCCHFIGSQGAGHFVKTVHNGIEYAEMQLIAELYHFLQIGLGLDNEQIANHFSSWCMTDSNSYLLDISSKILRHKEDDDYLLDLILDKASHKGTGAWATIAGAELGVSVSMMAAALNARQLTALKSKRISMAATFTPSTAPQNIDVAAIKKAYDLARLLNHDQGFELLRSASEQYNWELNLGEIAQTWSGGCIIKSSLMEDLEKVYAQVESLLFHPNLIMQIKTTLEALESFVIAGVKGGIPLACFMEALLYVQMITQARSSGNMIQAQRDFFGSHQYQKINDSSQKWYHNRW